MHTFAFNEISELSRFNSIPFLYFFFYAFLVRLIHDISTLFSTSGNRQDLTNILKQNALQFTISEHWCNCLSQFPGSRNMNVKKYSPLRKAGETHIVLATHIGLLHFYAFPSQQTAVIITKFFHS